MIKKILSIAFIAASITVNAQSFSALYDFTNTSTSSGTTDPTPPPTATGLTFGSFSAVGTPSANPNAGGRFSFLGWPLGATNGATTVTTMTGSINPNQYYEVTLTPAANYTVSLSTMSFRFERSGTGVRSYAVRSSQSSYSVNLPASVSSNSNISVVNSDEFFLNPDINSGQNGSTITFGPTSFSSPITLRFYGWNAEQSGGSFSIDNVVFNGSVSCPTPSITSISSNGPICANQNLELSATASGDGTLTYTWAGNGTISDASALTTTVTNASGDYTLSASNYCSTVSSVINPTVNAIPVVQVNSTAICNGGTATLTATGADTYTWSTGSNSASINDNPVTETTYTVTGTSAQGCLATTYATATISIVSTPTISVNNATICAGKAATLTASGATSYTWSGNQNTASISVSPIADESYTVSVSVPGCVGTFSNVANVTVNQLPTLSITGNTVICAGSATTLTAIGANSFTWSAGSQTYSSISIVPTATTSLTYTLTGLSLASCSNTIAVPFTVNPLPVLTTSNTSICIGETANLSVSGAQSYTWTSPQVIGTTYTATPTSTGVTIYTVVGTSSLSCQNTKTVSITVRALPNISANANSTVICAGQSVTLFGLGGGLNTYTWSSNVSNGTAFTPTSTQTYTVESTGAFNNCSNTATITITVNPCTSIQEFDATTKVSIMPNPNNGNFSLNSAFSNSEIVIFDVTGKQVYKQMATDYHTQLDLSGLENGIYYLQVKSGSTVISEKIIITK